jgi:polyisoprenoid-binding protein YceI
MTTATTTPLAPSSIATGNWKVLAEDSEVGFETRIAFGLIPVRGRFTEFAGELHVDGDERASGELRITAEKISTGINKRDRHLRSSDFFAVEEHPHLTFELVSLVPVSDRVLQLSGTLYVRGHALAIDAPVSVEQTRPGLLRIGADFDVAHRSSDLHKTGSGWKKVPAALHAHVALTLEQDA